LKVNGLWRKTAQGCDSKVVMGAIPYTLDSRRVSGVPKWKTLGRFL
jgi:hypothetical protein